MLIQQLLFYLSRHLSRLSRLVAAYIHLFLLTYIYSAYIICFRKTAPGQGFPKLSAPHAHSCSSTSIGMSCLRRAGNVLDLRAVAALQPLSRPHFSLRSLGVFSSSPITTETRSPVPRRAFATTALPLGDNELFEEIRRCDQAR